MKRELIRNLAFVLTLALAAAAQNNQADPISTTQLQIPLQVTPGPASASLGLQGNPGPQTIYYWLVTNYKVGASTPAGPFIITTAPNILSVSNYVQVFPTYPLGSLSIDVLKTSTPTPPSGACACAVATGQTGSAINDQSNSTSAYTVNPVSPALLQLTLQNEPQSAGVSHLILRQNGLFVADLSTAGGGVTSLSGTPNQIDVAPTTGAAVASLDPVVQTGSGRSMAPINIGQVVGNQFWMQSNVPTFTGAMTLTGGALSTNPYTVAVVYNTAAGSTLSSIEETTNTSYNGTILIPSTACTSGPSCAIVLDPITLPAGYTSWSAYMNLQSAGSGQEKLVSTCTNIPSGSGCTITAVGTGGTLPTVNTAFIQPTNLQATECPFGSTPSIFFPDPAGNSHTWLGLDWNSNNGQTSGTPEICHRTWFTDMRVTPPGGNNAFVVIDHRPGVGTSLTNQDRALWVNEATLSTDTATHYGLEAIQAELDILGAAGFAINGSPDGEATAGSFQISDNVSANYSGGSFGNNVQRLSYFKSGAGTISGGDSMNVSRAEFTAQVNSFTGGSQGTVYNAYCSNSTGGVLSNVACNGLKFHGPNNTASRYGNGMNVLYVQSNSSYVPTAGADFLVRNDMPALIAYLNGSTAVSALQTNNVAALGISASASVAGSFATAAATALTLSSVTCPAGGASTFTYQLVAVDGNGGAVASNTVNSTTNCTNPLTAGNPATINPLNTFVQQALQAQFVRIDVYRTAGPMGTGKIGSLSCSPGPSTTPYCAAFLDTGLTADGGTPPTANTTGTASHVGYTANKGNKFFVTTNFTTANNTNLQAIPGLSFTLLPVAANYQFRCAGAYSQATATAAVSFGIQSVTIAPTNIFATSTMELGAGPPRTSESGVLATLTTTTATSVVSGTPGAISTNYVWEMDGTIENPANDAGNTVNIMVSTANGADAVTIPRGSECQLY